jgi:GAF domain-containing protein
VSIVPSLDLAEVARLADGDEDPRQVLQRIVGHAQDLVPGCTGAGLTVLSREGAQDAAVTDDRVQRCRAVQFVEGGAGPARETLTFGEPRRSDDLRAEPRWPGFTSTARSCGFVSCLSLPLRSDRHGATALALYGARPGVFTDTTFDVVLFFAAQGGVALDNAARYRQSRELVEHLHAALTSRSLIERAKGLLMGRHQLGSEEAFDLLRRQSQHSDRKLRDVAVGLLEQHDPGAGDLGIPWTPPRRPGGAPAADDVRSTRAYPRRWG